MRLPAAAIDLGTNTARLLIGSVGPSGNISRMVEKRRVTRLGGGFTREEGIAREAWERSLAAMVDFADEIKLHGATTVRAVATSAVRDAVNGKSFCDEVLARTAIRLEVIDSRTEGLLTLEGVFAGLGNASRDVLVLDIGGGSTEYTLSLNGELLFTESLALGVVRLTEGKKDLIPMEGKISRELTALKARLGNAGLLDYINKVRLVGTAGTATTLAAISMKLVEYDYKKVNNYCLSLHEIVRIFALLYPMTAEDRLQVPGLEKGREDLIIAGTLLTLKTMEMFAFTQLTVSDFGLLEGVLLSV